MSITDKNIIPLVDSVLAVHLSMHYITSNRSEFTKPEIMCLTLIFRYLFEGPDNWHKEFPVAKEGKRQSPIDIQTAKAVLDEKLRAKVSETR